ncbi:MAG: sodium:calcium antiporter [Flavobacteriales bacterium]|nr:sodium:calcium antiporter [Flavobacteriales bacterium]
MEFLLLILGLSVLVAGGEFLVKGAVGIATNLEISPLVIGMTVVSFGTSAPELLVSLQAATEGSPEIAVGNVIGSNIANLALVLGVTVLIFPIIVERQTKLIDWPMMLLSTLFFYVFLFDGVIECWEGLVLFSSLVIFVTWRIRKSRKDSKLKIDEHVGNESTLLTFGYLILGLIGLYFGSGWFVEGAVGTADYLDVPKGVVGVTVVAFGTSAPELVVSCVAAYRKQSDISIGTLLGSNIFNIMAVIGLTSIVSPIELSEAGVRQFLNFDMYWVAGIAVALLPMLYFGAKFGRLKGAVLLISYLVYISIIVSANM